MQNNQELDLYLRKIRASFGKRLTVGIFDLFYLLCILFPVFIYIVFNDDKGLVSTFHKIVESPKHKLPAKRCFTFSLIVIVVLYIYFVYIPSTSDYQTFFSNSFNIRAIDISNGFNINARPTQAQLFKANAIPIFLLPFVNAIFFCWAWAWGDKEGNTWIEIIKRFGEGPALIDPKMNYQKRFDGAIKILFTGLFLLQLHYMFTVATTKKALNWFTKSTGVFYVDLDKLAVLQEEGNAFEKTAIIELPGADIEYEELNEGSPKRRVPAETAINE